LALINDLRYVSYLGIKPSITGILALALGTAAFFISFRKKSFIVSGSLIIQGLANMSAAVLAGATIGIPFGAWIFILGVVKLAISARLGERKTKVEPAIAAPPKM
jgi:hypothetical protein